MINSTSVKLRIIVSVSSNVLRALISFATGVLIARSLNPSGYGDMMFLLGSFVALRSLMDLGSSSAFFTFLSQRQRGRRFYLFYFSWLLIQFIVTLTLLELIGQSYLFKQIWLGHDAGIVMLAFVAVFMQQQIWQMISQIGEAMRKTIKVQLLNLVVSFMYLTITALGSAYGWLKLEWILCIIVVQYVLAMLLAYFILREAQSTSMKDEKNIREMMHDYWRYCKPLSILAVFSFVYDFADKWMLQKFGGAAQQGFFQIASQFAAVSILITTSTLNVFWKEIAEAWEKNNKPRVEMLYCKVNRGLVMLGAIVSGMLIPWAEQIIRATLGANYVAAWPILAIMLLYPIHQSMGQVGGAMLFATRQTGKYTLVSIAVMLISIPATYMLLAPTNQTWVSGYEMGAMGLAFKMVALGIVSVNVQAWVIARIAGWKFDWKFQVVGIPFVVGIGYLAKAVVELYWDLNPIELSDLITPISLAFGGYLTGVAWLIWLLPWLIGMTHTELFEILKRIKF